MALKLFLDISNQVHDASGIEDPQMYWWANQFGVWYPQYLIEEDQFNEYARNFLDELDLQCSLDEIPRKEKDFLLPSDLVKLEYLLEIFHKL